MTKFLVEKQGFERKLDKCGKKNWRAGRGKRKRWLWQERNEEKTMAKLLKLF